MKLIARFTLFIFVAFLTTPTLVTLIEKSTDVSMFYSLSEEESHKDIKQINVDLRITVDFAFITAVKNLKSKIISNNLIRHDKITEEIFIPPPDLV